MTLYGDNSAWDRQEVHAEVYAKNGTWMADPEGASYGRYICHSLVFSNTAPAPNTGKWFGIPQIPEGYDVTWVLGLVGNTADGIPVWAWSTSYGSTECTRPEEWADDILIGQTLSQWLSRHTKKQIEDLAEAKDIKIDLYVTTNKETPLTLHWHNTSQHQLDFHLLWFPYGSYNAGDFTTVSFSQMSTSELVPLFFENYNAVVNDGGTYHTWGDLNNYTFNTLPTYKKLLLNKASTNPLNSADFYKFMLLATYEDDNNNEVVKYASKRLFVSIPIKINTASDVKSQIQYFTDDGLDLKFNVTFTVHLDEEIPSDVQDDINITRDIDDDSHDNSDGGKNDTSNANIQDGTGTETTGLLTTTYSLTAEQTRILGQKIWSQSYFDVLKIQTDPIQNVVSVKAFPFSIAGQSQNIKIGDVDMQCTGSKVSKNTKILTVGSVTVPKHFKSFLDYTPFTQIEVFIPYCGIMSLDTSLVMGQTLTFDYIVDLVTGASRCRCKIGTTIIAEWDCTMGVDIPLSSTDRATSDAKHLASIGAGIGFGALGGAVGAISGGVSGVLNGIGDGYHTSRTSGGSPTVSSNDNNSIFLIINRPQPIESAGYNHTYGKMLKLYKTLSSMSGYTEVGEIDLTDIPLTQAESEELKNILRGGFYA